MFTVGGLLIEKARIEMTVAQTGLSILFCFLGFLYGIDACGNKKFRRFMHSKIKLVKENEAEKGG